MNLNDIKTITNPNDDIAAKCGQASFHLRFCPIHSNEHAFDCSSHPKYDNILFLYCSKCVGGHDIIATGKKARHELGRWMVCTLCPKSRISFTKEKQVTKHQKNVHGLLSCPQKNVTQKQIAHVEPIPISTITVNTSFDMTTNNDDDESVPELNFDGYSSNNQLFFHMMQ